MMDRKLNGDAAPASRQPPAHAPGALALTATGAGTAMASVCAIGLLAMQDLVGGIWSVAAVLVAGLVCAFLARVFARLAAIIPSGASMVAYATRGLGRSGGMLLVLPYFLAMLLLAGFEAIVVGELGARIVPLPPLVGAALFLIVTWAICRAGLRIGYRTQAVATVFLFLLLVAVSLAQVLQAAELGLLHQRLLPAAPHPAAFLAAVGQALFLFMGFELVTAHAEVARRGAVGPALRAGVVVLTAFYATLALGLACMPDLPASSADVLVPQLAMASRIAVPGVVVVVAGVCVLASFTSYNGALLGLSRFTYALARQGLLSRRLAVLHPRSSTARPALAALLFITMASTAVIYTLNLYRPVMFAAAVAAALVYACMTIARQRPPFLEQAHARLAPLLGTGMASLLLALAAAVVVGADASRPALVLVLLSLATLAAWTAYGMHAGSRAEAGGQRRRVRCLSSAMDPGR